MPEPAADALQALRDRLEETRVQAQQLAEDVAAGRIGPEDLADGPDPGAAGASGGAGAGARGADAGGAATGGGAGARGAGAGSAASGGGGGARGAGAGGAGGPGDLQALVGLLEVLRELVPPDLQQQLAEVTRQVLLLVRALIDWWVERLEPPAERPRAATATGADPRPAHDIPVT